MRIALFWRVLPVYMVVVGLIALPIWQRHLAFARTYAAGLAAQAEIERQKQATPPLISGKANRLLLPRLGIDVPVLSGIYNANQTVWRVSDIAANYAVNTAENNNRQDKTLIYGHWTERILGKTRNLQAGDLAYVYTDNGHVLKYSYESKEVIKPADVTIFEKFKGSPGLVLMTCQGTWAQERRIMYFKLEEAR